MNKRFYLILLICLPTIGNIHAQWTEKDSLWILDILSGKEKVRLNQETLKAIESGTLIGVDKSILEPISAPTQLPITKYFEGILPPDTSISAIDFSKLPVSVFVQFGPKAVLIEELGSFLITPKERDTLISLTPQVATFNAENITRTIFWKSHRAKMRNRKKANAWKTYNDYW